MRKRELEKEKVKQKMGKKDEETRVDGRERDGAT